jgi:hypothetical protein
MSSLRDPAPESGRTPSKQPSDGPGTPSPTAGDDFDELIRELARYCAEIFFQTHFSEGTVSDDS